MWGGHVSRRAGAALLALLPAVAAGPARGAELAGVTMPDTTTLGGRTLVLNGMGLREQFFVDVYVGGLYLTARTRDAERAIEQDAPKRILLQFVIRSLGKRRICDANYDALEKLAERHVMQERFDRLCDFMEDVRAGDRIVLDYVPDRGTTVTVRGKPKGTIEGAAFMRAVWSLYVGDDPPTAELKRGMLGL